MLLAHVPFQWGALTGRGRLWGRPSGSRLTEPLPALSSLSSRVWVLLWVGRHWWPGRLVPGVTLHQHLFRTLECGLPREAFPEGVGKPAFGYLGQSKVYDKHGKSCQVLSLFLDQALSLCSCGSDCAGKAVKWAVLLSWEKNALSIQEMSVPPVDDTPAHWFRHNSKCPVCTRLPRMFSCLGQMSRIGVDRRILAVVGFQIIFHIWQQLWSERPLDDVKKQFGETSVSWRDSGSDISKWCAMLPCSHTVPGLPYHEFMLEATVHSGTAVGTQKFGIAWGVWWDGKSLSVSHLGQKSDLSVWKQEGHQ